MSSIRPLHDFPEIIRPATRLAALDIGTKTIGIALSTPEWRQDALNSSSTTTALTASIVTPLATITRSKWVNDLAALEKALQHYDIGGVIVGLPYNMDGSEGSRAQGVKQVVFNIIKAEPAWLGDCPIAFVDERLSTAGAVDLTTHHKNSRAAKKSGALDALAAQLILEKALAELRKPS